MKKIKEFKSSLELYAVTDVLEEKGIKFETEELALYALAGDIIRVRDIILDVIKEMRS